MSERANTQRFNRRHFLGAVGGAAVMTVIGCGNEQKSTFTQATTPIVKPTDTPLILTESSYIALSPKDKLKILESRGLSTSSYAEIPGFNPEKELATAVAEAYNQVTPLIRPTREIADSVKFQTKDEYLKSFEITQGVNLTDSQKETEHKTRPEFTKDRVVYLNRNRINEIIEATSSQDVAKRFTKNELSVKIYESILFHALTHANNNAGHTDISPFSLRLPNSTGPTNFTSLEEFNFLGQNADGSLAAIHGAQEAITEFIGRAVAIKATGQYFSLSDDYGYGANLIAQINLQAGISVDEFLSYNSQEQTAKMLEKWGSIKNTSSPDIKAATMALAVIGLGLQQVIKPADAVGYINQTLTLVKPIK